MLHCTANCTLNGVVNGDCVPNDNGTPVCDCYEGFTGEACNEVLSRDDLALQNSSAKSETTILLSVFLAALLIFTFLLVASWYVRNIV